jgi:sugar (pentulose or hexulose) kinase
MSLLGIDVGSSSIKVGAYSEDGELLAVARGDVSPQHPQPGWWEQDPEEVWRTTSRLVSGLVKEEALERDPPKVLAISASVRENFPADSNGKPLGPCIMAADVRGSEFEMLPKEITLPDPWSLSCGHMRERMDPFNRLLWWQKNHPDILQNAKCFPGWHEFLALRLCGRYVTDCTIAGRWLLYDLKSRAWAKERLAKYDVEDRLIPEILPWGSIIGDVRGEVLEEWGISQPLQMAVGASDLNCAALGAGVSAVGDICLVSGSFENLLISTDEFPTSAMLLKGLSVTTHPGKAKHAVWAICPTGTAVLNWARTLMNITIEDLNDRLGKSGPEPSPVLAVPYLSGAFIYWENGRKLRGSLFGLTLATSQIDIVKAFMESIAYDHVNTLSLLRDEGVRVDYVRAMGGGTRSLWWTQLKSDMLGIPIEVIGQPEPGTRGAALLAGLAVGAFDNITQASNAFTGTIRIHEPDLKRAALHSEKLEKYRGAVQNTLSTFYANEKGSGG